jgi:flagella basal body P-ring formation protein FlgA
MRFRLFLAGAVRVSVSGANLAVLAGIISGPVLAQSVVATRLIPAQRLIVPEDVTVVDVDIDGAVRELSAVEGRMLRRIVYPGGPVRLIDLAAPVSVDRNQTVTLVFMRGPLSITAEGRALGRGGIGEVIRVLNLESRRTVSGQIAAGAKVLVTQ